uniref:Uncharacterized protein n=1 Tax=viral metagenome TaxID=1070528 RepID=A0A6C0CS10_9ZZZZ
MPIYAFIDTKKDRIVQLSQQLPKDIINRWDMLKNKFPNQSMPNYVEKAIQYNDSQLYQYIIIPFEIMPYYTLHITKNELNEYVITYMDTRPPPEAEPVAEPILEIQPLIEESTPLVE